MAMLSEYEVQFLLFLQDNFRSDFGNYIFSIITLIGYKGIVPILVGLVFVLLKKYRPAGLCIAVSLILNTIIVHAILKPIVARPRPYVSFPELNGLAVESDFCFPSGHTSACFAVAFVIIMLLPKRYGIPAIIISILVGFSRLYLGVHYPTDVIFGALIAFITALIGVCFYKKFQTLRICQPRDRSKGLFANFKK